MTDPQTLVSSLTTSVPLGTAANYAVLAESAITNVPSSYIVGNVGLSPAASSGITGYGLVLDSSGQFGELFDGLMTPRERRSLSSYFHSSLRPGESRRLRFAHPRSTHYRGQ